MIFVSKSHGFTFSNNIPLKPLGQYYPDFNEAPISREKEILFTWFQSLDQGGRHAHMFLKPLKTIFPVNFKKDFINKDDPINIVSLSNIVYL